MDSVGRIIEQWGSERPELDVSGLEVIGRISRLASVVQVKLDAVFAEFGLQGWEFDVLSSLRREGAPYELTPGMLDEALIISSGTTTHRLRKLEERGFVTRRQDAEDGRVWWVRLTDAGREVQAAAHDAHAANELEILAGLSDADAAALKRGLVAFARLIDTGEAP
ncbi:MAG: MarR family transcriptional regulator [Demequina sp.]|nr:MarR family transcriptional regulator [Demequina sp.]